MSTPWIVVVLMLWAVVVVLAVVVAGLLRRLTPLLDRADRAGHAGAQGNPFAGLAVGSRPAPFDAVDDDGREWHRLPADGPSVVLLTSPGCPPCASLLAALRAGPPITEVPLVVVTSDSATGSMDAPEWALSLYQRGRSVSEAFQSSPTPHAFALDEHGRVVASTVPGSRADLMALVSSATRQTAEP